MKSAAIFCAVCATANRMTAFLEMYAAAALALCTQHAALWIRDRFWRESHEYNDAGYAPRAGAPAFAAQASCYSESDDGHYANL